MHILSVAISNIKNTSIRQIKEKSFLIALYFPLLWNCKISLLVCLLNPLFGIKEMSLFLAACFKTWGLETTPWRLQTALKSGKLLYPTELLEKSFHNGFSFCLYGNCQNFLTHHLCSTETALSSLISLTIRAGG